MAEQLDLLSWRAPCQIVPFPASRLVGRARLLVDASARLEPAVMDRTWDRTIAELDRQMERAGLSLPIRDQQLHDFAALTKAEIVRRSVCGFPRMAEHGGDAA